MKYLLIISCLLFTSVGWSKDVSGDYEKYAICYGEMTKFHKRTKLHQTNRPLSIDIKERVCECYSKGEIDERIAGIKVYQNQETLDANNDNIPDPIAAADLQRKIQEGETKLNIEKQKAITEARSQSFEEVKEKNKIDLRSEDKYRFFLDFRIKYRFSWGIQQ